MKKIIAMVTAMMLTASMAACGSGKADSSADAASTEDTAKEAAQSCPVNAIEIGKIGLE